MDRIEEITPELADQVNKPDKPIENRAQQGAPDADTEIFNRFLAGSDEAFRTLYDSYERPLYLYVVRLVGTETDAQDVFQEIWVRMYRLRGEKKEVKRFSGLLFTIARNLAINMIRDRKVLPDTSIDDMAFDAEALLRTQDVEVADIRDMLERALLQLPVAQREAFILREYNGYSYQEIADIMGTPMVTAKTRAWRGREALRKMISAWMGLSQNRDSAD
jgi:RNA polymerase sigma-70 factor (ECF subfamily)